MKKHKEFPIPKSYKESRDLEAPRQKYHDARLRKAAALVLVAGGVIAAETNLALDDGKLNPVVAGFAGADVTLGAMAYAKGRRIEKEAMSQAQEVVNARNVTPSSLPELPPEFPEEL